MNNIRVLHADRIDGDLYQVTAPGHSLTEQMPWNRLARFADQCGCQRIEIKNLVRAENEAKGLTYLATEGPFSEQDDPVAKAVRIAAAARI